MTSVRRGLIALLFCGLWVAPQRLFASNCICTQYPTFPYSGNYWMHYAIQTSDNCVQGAPCPQIQPYTNYQEQCGDASTCNQCSTMGDRADVATVVGAHLHTVENPLYTTVDTKAEIKAFLIRNTLLTGGDYTTAVGHLENELEFESPIGTNPPVVRLHRNVGGAPQEFYAVLWKMRLVGGTWDWSYMGVEIADAHPPGTVWDNTSIFRAFVFAQNEELIQPIVVKGLLEVQANNTLYLIRLFDSRENKRNDAFLVRYSRPAAFSLTKTAPFAPTGSFVAANQMQERPFCARRIQLFSGIRNQSFWRCPRRRYR